MTAGPPVADDAWHIDGTTEGIAMTGSSRSAGAGVGTEQLLRWSGWALVAALPLQVAGFLLHPASEELEHLTSSWYGPAHTLLFASWVLVMLGLPGLHARQAARAGRLGLVGFVVAMAAVAYHLYLTLYEAFAIPAMVEIEATHPHLGPDGALGHGAGALGPLAGPLLLGFPLLGVATVRAGVLPRLAGWLQVAAIPVFVAAMLVIGAALGGEVGSEADTWIAGMLPISSLYWVLCAGFAVGGRALAQAGAADVRRAAGATPAQAPVAG